jgi:eukaryotic-like serine/threonine-protein kinase
MNQARMSPERWREIKPLLESALELKAEDRRAFLDKACAGDDELRREVESFLDASEQAGDFMDKPALEEAARMLAEDKDSNKRRSSDATLIGDRRDFPLAPGETLDGRYLIEGALGEGSGVGQVFLARNLKTPAETKVEVEKDEANRHRELKGRGEVLAVVAPLEHG